MALYCPENFPVEYLFINDVLPTLSQSASSSVSGFIPEMAALPTGSDIQVSIDATHPESPTTTIFRVFFCVAMMICFASPSLQRMRVPKLRSVSLSYATTLSANYFETLQHAPRSKKRSAKKGHLTNPTNSGSVFSTPVPCPQAGSASLHFLLILYHFSFSSISINPLGR